MVDAVCYAQVTKVGRTSIQVAIDTWGWHRGHEHHGWS